ncbi:MAG: hypothetical protein M1833_001191 [Piccolia ochrophora]|nr:MAG: hypothetical protein M1833_001191 [Piccolia ochrophora]
MTSEQPTSTHDLRSEAVEYNRTKAQNVKWALGKREYIERNPMWPDLARRRPKAVPEKRPPRSTFDRREHESNTNKLSRQTHVARKLDFLAEQSATESDRSDEDAHDGAREPPIDVDITYSYDAPRGPRNGDNILGLALAKAVEKFEGQETEKMIQEEYEIVSPSGLQEEESRQSMQDASVEEGFELI